MKNWLPFVLGPELAMAKAPVLYSFGPGSSSPNWYPGPPLPLSSGSPPWITKSGTIRWKAMPSKKWYRASTTKLLTVFGAFLSSRVRVITPFDVFIAAV